jgi:hypothetical protein
MNRAIFKTRNFDEDVRKVMNVGYNATIWEALRLMTDRNGGDTKLISIILRKKEKDGTLKDVPRDEWSKLVPDNLGTYHIFFHGYRDFEWEWGTMKLV